MYVCVRAQSRLTLCDPKDCTHPPTPLSSSVRGILQARILEWVAMPFSRGSSPPRDQTRVSCMQIPYHLSYWEEAGCPLPDREPRPSPKPPPQTCVHSGLAELLAMVAVVRGAPTGQM